jgi:hypothetical protein
VGRPVAPAPFACPTFDTGATARELAPARRFGACDGPLELPEKTSTSMDAHDADSRPVDRNVEQPRRSAFTCGHSPSLTREQRMHRTQILPIRELCHCD